MLNEEIKKSLEEIRNQDQSYLFFYENEKEDGMYADIHCSPDLMAQCIISLIEKYPEVKMLVLLSLMQAAADDSTELGDNVQ